MDDSAWIPETELLAIEGKFDAAFERLSQVDPIEVADSELGLLIYFRLLLSIGMKVMPRLALKKCRLAAGKDYAIRLLLRRAKGLAIQPPPDGQATSEEATAAMRVVELIGSTDPNDFEPWVRNSTDDPVRNPRPLYALIALEYAGVSNDELEGFATRMALLGYLEGRFLTHACAAMRFRGMPRRAERLARLGIARWPDHGGLWQELSLALGDQGERKAAAAAAIKASSQYAFSGGAKHQAWALLRLGHFRDLIAVLKRHAGCYRRYVPVVTRILRVLEDRSKGL